MKKFIMAAFFIACAQAAFADLSLPEQDDLFQCAEQFELIRSEEIGEETSLELKWSKGGVRVFRLVQGGQARGYLQIDVQGDISQVTESGELIRICQ